MKISLARTIDLCRDLASDVRQSGWQPDCVFGISRKGAVIGYCVAEFLRVPLAVIPVVLGRSATPLERNRRPLGH